MIIQSFFSYAFVGRVKEVFSCKVERSFEEKHTRHDANGVGGSSLEDQVVQSFHF